MRHFPLTTVGRAFVIALVIALFAPSPVLAVEQAVKSEQQAHRNNTQFSAQLMQLPDATVTYSGVRKKGAKLTAVVTGWSDPSIEITYQWLRGNKKIKGATSKTYKQVKADNKRNLRVQVTGNKPGYETVRITSLIPKAENGENCTIIGSAANDNLRGTTGKDVICGFDGDDTIDGGKGSDTIDGGDGDDEIYGGNGNDEINGGDDDDYIDGENGNDEISGGDDDDGIIGGPGDDDLNGDGGTPGDIERNVCHDDGSQIVYCGYDESAPEISEITVDKTTIDTSTGEQTVTFNFKVTDDLLGTAGAWCSATQVNKGGKYVSSWAQLVSGNNRDGDYTCSLTFPRWSTPGDWYVSFKTQDWAYSHRTYLATDENNLKSCEGQYVTKDCEFTVLSGPGIIKLSGTADSEPPELQSFTMSETTVSTAEASQKITLRARITDDLSGMGLFWNCNIQSATGRGVVSCRSSWKLVEGTPQDGVWEKEITLQKGLPPGTYLVSMSIRDQVGNIRDYSANGLKALASTRNGVRHTMPADAGFTQTGAESNATFAISKISLSTTEVFTASQPVTVHIKLTTAAGSMPIFNNGCFAFEPISKTQIWGGPSTPEEWTPDVCHIEFPRGARRGTYLISVWGYGEEVIKYGEFKSNNEGTGFINVHKESEFISTPSSVTVK